MANFRYGWTYYLIPIHLRIYLYIYAQSILHVDSIYVPTTTVHKLLLFKLQLERVSYCRDGPRGELKTLT